VAPAAPTSWTLCLPSSCRGACPRQQPWGGGEGEGSFVCLSALLSRTWNSRAAKGGAVFRGASKRVVGLYAPSDRVVGETMPLVFSRLFVIPPLSTTLAFTSFPPPPPPLLIPLTRTPYTWIPTHPHPHPPPCALGRHCPCAPGRPPGATTRHPWSKTLPTRWLSGWHSATRCTREGLWDTAATAWRLCHNGAAVEPWPTTGGATCTSLATASRRPCGTPHMYEQRGQGIGGSWVFAPHPASSQHHTPQQNCRHTPTHHQGGVSHGKHAQLAMKLSKAALKVHVGVFADRDGPATGAAHGNTAGGPSHEAARVPG
jgi:hypothetical protein